LRILCVFGQHNYGDPTRGEGYEYTHFIPAFRRLGHEVLFLESWNRDCARDFAELNSNLLRTVERHRPDVVFSVMFTYEVWLETWEILRDAGFTATVNWTTDDSWKYSQSSRFLAPAFHAFTTTYPEAYRRYLRDGITHIMLTQWGANPDSLMAPLPAVGCRYPVSFIGTAHGRRRPWIEWLRRQGVEVACFGKGWPNGSVDTSEVRRIIRESAVSLNFSNAPPTWEGMLPRRINQIKARIFEVPGAGGFLLTEWAKRIEDYYIPGKEVSVFLDREDLREKIRYYLDHPAERDAIALAGYKRTCEEHTYERRLIEVLSHALQQKEEAVKQGRALGTRTIDWPKFENARKKHQANKWLQTLGKALSSGYSMIWGPVRGPRAARRFLYEISWRLVGGRTYSASGWPGRMYYRS